MSTFSCYIVQALKLHYIKHTYAHILHLLIGQHGKHNYSDSSDYIWHIKWKTEVMTLWISEHIVSPLVWISSSGMWWIHCNFYCNIYNYLESLTISPPAPMLALSPLIWPCNHSFIHATTLKIYYKLTFLQNDDL